MSESYANPSARAATAGAAVQDRPSRIRVLLADDHAVVRQGLVRLLQDQPDIEVVAEATDGQQAVQLARVSRPDVVIMDIHMPNNGMDATRRIVSEIPSVQVIALTVYKSPDMESLLLKAGAKVYLNKDEPFSVLLETIRSCFRRAA